MDPSVLKIPFTQRQKLRRIVQRSPDREYARRANALLLLHQLQGSVSRVARLTCAARSSVQRWRALWLEYGLAGIAPQPRGRSDWKATDTVLQTLETLVHSTPTAHGYLRSRWSSELLALELHRATGVAVHATTVRRWLRRLQFVYRRARPTLHIRDPRKSERLRAIHASLHHPTPGTEVFYVDEADVDLNPKIGQAWTVRGQQLAIPTPGKNRKRYLAGALHARTGKVVWVEGERKDSLLFIHLLYEIHHRYRGAKRILIILDNYKVHDSAITRRWLTHHPKVRFLFQPAYHPWVNRIERLWKALHDTVTRNHRQPSLEKLMTAVRRFMQVCQPFPGNRHALATAA
jgi:transposase